jgi:hypothetical protein
MFPHKKLRETHRVGEISFRQGMLECRCGWMAEPDTPAGLALSYQKHRRDVGLQSMTVGGGSYKDKR